MVHSGRIRFGQYASIGLAGWLFCVMVGLASAAGIIRPEARWLDNRGRIIQAHGGCILRQGKWFYLFGEDRSRSNNPKERYVGCYRSTDLVHWRFRNKVVELRKPAGLRGDWILERPKVFYNRATRKFVMYTHIDAKHYSLAEVAVFVCNTVDGNYRYLRRFRPLGHQSRDIGQYTDRHGRAYLLFEDRPFGFRIAELSANDLAVKTQICLIPMHLEGLGLVHYHGLYYVIGSHLTGWRANPDLYATAKSMAGPWSKFHNIAPPKTNTYGSQSGFLLKIHGTKATTVVYMGDIWHAKHLWNSRYLWMPLDIGHGQLRLPPPASWKINVYTGRAEIQRQ